MELEPKRSPSVVPMVGFQSSPEYIGDAVWRRPAEGESSKLVALDAEHHPLSEPHKTHKAKHKQNGPKTWAVAFLITVKERQELWQIQKIHPPLLQRDKSNENDASGVKPNTPVDEGRSRATTPAIAAIAMEEPRTMAEQGRRGMGSCPGRS